MTLAQLLDGTTVDAPGQQEARRIIIARLMASDADITDMAFLLKDRGSDADYRPALARLVQDGYARENRNTVPTSYSLTWRYWFKEVFTW